MTNALLKTIVRSYSPGSPGVPAFAGRPFLPARWETRTRTVCSYSQDYNAMLAAGWVREYVPPNPMMIGSQGSYVWVSPQGGVSTQVPYVHACRTETYQVFVAGQSYVPPTPGTPPTPAQTLTDYRIGWTGRARSIKSVEGSVRAEFKVPSTTTGAVVGLNTSFKQSGYRDIRFAFYLSHGVARIMERGVIAAQLGAYADGATFKIRRHGGLIHYYINNVEVHSSSNDSAPMHLDAALYTGGDSVTDPEIVGESYSEGTLAPLLGMAQLPGRLPALIGSGSALNRASNAAELGGLVGLGSNKIYGTSTAKLPPLTGSAESGSETPSYALGAGILAVLSGVGAGLTGTVGGGASVLPALLGIAADRPYASGAGSLRGLSGWGYAYDAPDEMAFFSSSIVDTPLIGEMELAVVMTSTGQVVGLLAYQALQNASVMSEAEATDGFSVQALLNAVMVSYATGSSVAPFDEETAQVWVLNAESGGSTRYENYPFNSFAQIGGAYYGAREDGIYRLDGETDNGLPVQAMVSLGKQDFGTTALKRLESCYLGASSTGKIFLKVIVEGAEYTYAARSSDDALKVQRVDVGRGLRANWLEFEIYNADGDDFELASVEFAAVPLSRRI